METLEEKIEGPPKSTREKDGSEAVPEKDDSPICQGRQEDVIFVDRATSPLKPMQSEFKGKFPVWVLRLGTVSGS